MVLPAHYDYTENYELADMSELANGDKYDRKHAPHAILPNTAPVACITPSCSEMQNGAKSHRYNVRVLAICHL